MRHVWIGSKTFLKIKLIWLISCFHSLFNSRNLTPWQMTSTGLDPDRAHLSQDSKIESRWKMCIKISRFHPSNVNIFHFDKWIFDMGKIIPPDVASCRRWQGKLRVLRQVAPWLAAQLNFSATSRLNLFQSTRLDLTFAFRSRMPKVKSSGRITSWFWRRFEQELDLV